MYTNETAELYASLGIVGTTYQTPFETVIADVSSLKGLRVLDFGCGAGRSTRLLKTLNPTYLIGIDYNKSMIEQAYKNSDASIEFVYIEKDELPFPDESFDIIFSSSVYCEFSDFDSMLYATFNLYRLLKEGGSFYMTTTNPGCLGADFVSFHYDQNPNIQDGDAMTCHVHTNPPFNIDDTWWSLPALDRVFEDCNFEIRKRMLPLATGMNWRDETRVAAAVIYHVVKPRV